MSNVWHIQKNPFVMLARSMTYNVSIEFDLNGNLEINQSEIVIVHCF